MGGRGKKKEKKASVRNARNGNKGFIAGATDHGRPSGVVGLIESAQRLR